VHTEVFDFCIARPIRFVVGLALNTYDDDDHPALWLASPHPKRELVVGF